jgi:hypothetical protein
MQNVKGASFLHFAFFILHLKPSLTYDNKITYGNKT